MKQQRRHTRQKWSTAIGHIPADFTSHPALAPAAAALGDDVLRDLAAAYNQARLRLESLQRDAADAEAFATAVMAGTIETEPRAWADALAGRQLIGLQFDRDRAKVKPALSQWLKRLSMLARRAGEQIAPGVADATNRVGRLQKQQDQLVGESPLHAQARALQAQQITRDSAADRAWLAELAQVIAACGACASSHGIDLRAVKLSVPLAAVPGHAVLIDG